MQDFWIFQLNTPLNSTQADFIETGLQKILATWNAHGTSLTAESKIMHQQFVYIGLKADSARASGCSIDSLVKSVQELITGQGLILAESGTIFIRSEQGFYPIDFRNIENLILSGEIKPDTIIADISLGKHKDYKGIMTPACDTWLGRYFTGKV